jgi:hypothetical protein
MINSGNGIRNKSDYLQESVNNRLVARLKFFLLKKTETAMSFPLSGNDMFMYRLNPNGVTTKAHDKRKLKIWN